MYTYTGCPKNGVLTVHYGVEETTVNVRKMFKKFYWTYLLIWRSLKVALNRKIILKYKRCFFKFGVEVGVGESIEIAPLV
jgi:hypothetical protein